MPNPEDDEMEAINEYDEATGAGEEPRDREIDEEVEDSRFTAGLINDAEAFDAMVKVFKKDDLREGRFNQWLKEVDADGDVIPRSVQTIEFSGDEVYVFYFQWI